MKRTLIITGIIVVITIIGLIIFNKIVSQKDTAGLFTEVSSGKFEITILTTGELIAENSIDIKGPAFSQGRDIHSTNIKITDLVPEGTTVQEGDYVATLDRTELENSLKDGRERLTSLQTQLEVLLLDTAIQMNSIRDQISNQRHTVEEAEIALLNSKYEPAPTIRDAEIDFDQAQRVLGQLERSYKLREAQTRVNVTNTRYWLKRIQKRINDYEEVLAGFTIYAPSSGMIIYKKNRLGRKRKVGSMIDAMDRVVATLPDLSSMISKVYVSEIEISKVKVGQTANITIDAFPTKSYNGSVTYVANIGEKLPNTDTKVFEVLIKIAGSDFNLRPAMTTNNKIMIKTLDSVTYIPTECVHTGTDSIPFVYLKSGHKQAVVLGESNEKNIVIEKGLEPGTLVYIAVPDKQEKFKLVGEEIIKKGSI
jgi:HlyD family secretion protein